jgi:hypothetical protein
VIARGKPSRFNWYQRAAMFAMLEKALRHE